VVPTAAKVAVTVRSWFMVTAQVTAPLLQGAPHPTNREDELAALAVRVTTVPLGYR